MPGSQNSKCKGKRNFSDIENIVKIKLPIFKREPLTTKTEQPVCYSNGNRELLPVLQTQNSTVRKGKKIGHQKSSSLQHQQALAVFEPADRNTEIVIKGSGEGTDKEVGTKKKKTPVISCVSEICKKSDKSKSKCSEHYKVYAEHKSFVCEVCNKMFVHKYRLVDHKKIHEGIKPFVCNVCQKGFVKRSNLFEHVTVHNNEKRFSCGACEKKFKVKGALQRHEKIHEDAKRFSCNTCKKCFTYKHHLIEHLKTHTGDKPHVCEKCLKSFTKKWTLDRHTKTHRDLKLRSADVCDLALEVTDEPDYKGN